MSKHTKQQKMVSFTQLMNNVDETIHTEKNESVSESTSAPKVQFTNPTPVDTSVPDGYTVQSDKDGIVVAKSQSQSKNTTISKTFTEATTVSNTKQSEKTGVENKDVESISKKIEAYLNCNNGLIMQDPSKQQRAGELFRDILFFATDHPSKEVLDVVYRFFKRNRDRVLAQEVALPPTLTFKKEITERIICIYTLFRGLTDEKPFRINTSTTRIMLHMPDNNKIDALLTYFENKQK